MNPQLYKVIFEGDVLPGFGQLDVLKKIAGYMSLQESDVARLSMGEQFEVKRHITLEQAKKLARAFARLGAISYLMSEDRQQEEFSRDDTVPVHEEIELSDGNGALNEDAFAAYFENKLKKEDIAETSYELVEPEDQTQPGGIVPTTDVRKVERAQQVARQLRKSVAGDEQTSRSCDVACNDDPTLPGGYPVYTDVNRIKKMQQVTQKMLSQKRPYD